jgi:hypothetical protein
MQASSETIAGDGVANREREEDECDGDHGEIQHEIILSTPTVIESKLAISRGTKSSRIRPAKAAPPSGVDEVPLCAICFRDGSTGNGIGIL